MSWNSFSAATKCVSGRLFCQWIGLRVSGRRFVFLHSRLCLILIIWNHNRCPPPPPEKKQVIIIGRPPPSKKKSNNNSTLPGPPHRFRELFLPLKSFPGPCSATNFVYGSFFLCLEIRFLRLLNVFLGAFSASESVSELLDAVLSFFTAVCGSLRCLLHSTRPFSASWRLRSWRIAVWSRRRTTPNRRFLSAPRAPQLLVFRPSYFFFSVSFFRPLLLH